MLREPFGAPFMAPFARQRQSAYLQKVLQTNPLEVWTLGEGAGLVAQAQVSNLRNGAYSNVTLDQPGIGDGGTAALFNGTTGWCNIYSASLIGAVNKQLGTMMLWVSTSPTAPAGRCIVLGSLDGGSNRIGIGINSPTSALVEYNANGTPKNVSFTITQNVFVCLAMTWSKAADQVKAFLGGVQQGSTLTGLGTWTTALSSNQCVIGGINSVPQSPFKGNLAFVALWANVLSPTQISALATVP